MALANKMLGKEILKSHNLNDTNQIVSEIDADVVSLIGVLERAIPYRVLNIKKNKENKVFIYFCSYI